MSRPKKYPDTKVKSVRFPTKLLERLDDLAKKRLTDTNTYIINALIKYTEFKEDGEK